MTERGANEQSLRQMVYHTDARVTAMEGSLSALSDSQSRQEQKIDQLVATLNTPDPINWSGWAAVGLALLIGVFGASSWVQDNLMLTLSPVVAEVSQNYDRVKEIERTVNRLRVNSAATSSDKRHMEGQITFLQEWQKKQDNEISKLQAQASTTENDRNTIHKMIEDLDKFGSRRWIAPITAK